MYYLKMMMEKEESMSLAIMRDLLRSTHIYYTQPATEIDKRNLHRPDVNGKRRENVLFLDIFFEPFFVKTPRTS